jgi:hypothetical protein
VTARRVFLVEPALRDARGHHAYAALRFVERFGPGRTVVVAAADWSGGAAIGGAPVAPLFRTGPWEAGRIRRYGRPAAAAIGALERLAPARLFAAASRGSRGGAAAAPPAASADARTTRSLLRPSLADVVAACGAGPEDALFLPSADAEQVRAAADLLADLDGRPCPRLRIRLMYDDPGRHPTDLSVGTALAALSAAPRAADLVRLAVETAAFSAEAADPAGRPADVLPHPPPERTPARSRDGDGRIVLYLPGAARADKGGGLAAAVLEALAACWRGPDRLAVAAHGDASPPPPLEAAPLPRHLAEDAYRRAWADADVALLLHDPAAYRRRGSGVVCDAVAAGVPFVCLEGTSLAEWTADGNGVAAAPDPGAVADAVVRVASGRDRRRAACAAARERLLRTWLSPLPDLDRGADGGQPAA